MMPAANKSSGQNMSMPDICNVPGTPPVPTPFVNMAALAQAMPPAITVKYGGVNALNMGSQIPMTTGDEPGSAGPIKGPGAFNMGNPTVVLEGQPGTHLMNPTRGNNAPIGIQSVPCVNMVLLSRLPGRAGDARPEPGAFARDYVIDAAALHSLARQLTLGNDAQGHSQTSGIPVGASPCSVRLRCFHLGVAEVVAHMLRKQRTAIDIDLRGNRGGLLSEAVAVASLLLDASERTRITVLVDAQTASGAEIVAHALQIHSAARIVGRPTAGKLSVHALDVQAAGQEPAIARYIGEAAPAARVEPDVLVG